MYEEQFKNRLSQLRLEKGVSARDMSLSIGQNAGYINNIETGKALPSMTSFFYICEYLEISPYEFFDIETKNPEHLRNLINNLKKLNPSHLEHISSLVQDLTE